MTKMFLDYELCEGHGECVIAAPEIFALDEAGDKAVLLLEDIPDGLLAKAREAVAICPIVALRLEG
jgi:ferredoxin